MIICSWIASVSAVAGLAVAAFVLFDNFHRAANRIFFFLGVALAVWSIGFLGLSIATEQTDIDFWTKVFYLGLSFVPALYYHFIAVSTENQKNRIRFFIFGGYFLSGLLIFLLFLGYFTRGTPSFHQFYLPNVGRGYTLFVFYYLFYSVFGAYLLLEKYRYSASIAERKQLFYLLVGLILAIIGSISNSLVIIGIKFIPIAYLAIASLLVLASYTLVGYRLIDVRAILRKGVSYSLFTGLLTAVFVVCILIFEKIFRNFTGHNSTFLVIVSAFLITLLFQPLRNKIQEFIDLAFFRRRHRQEQELKRFSREVISILDKDTLLFSTLNTIAQSLYIKRGGILLWDKDEKKYLLKAAVGWSPEKDFFLAQNNILVDCLERNRREIFIHQLEESAHLSWVSSSICRQLKSMDMIVSIPMVAKNKLLGILLLGERNLGVPYSSDDLDLLTVLVDEASIALENANLYEDTKQHFFRTIQSLVAAVEAKDAYTRGHCERVAHYAVAIARNLGMPSSSIEALRIGAFLHDIGKIGISERILLKSTQLTDDEYKIIQEHPLIGTKILEPIFFGKEIIDIVKYHHEKIDGSGYPEGLKKDLIPLPARILAVADVFEALTSNRAYRKSLTPEDALHIIQLGAGKHFDDRVVSVFMQLINEGFSFDKCELPLKDVYLNTPGIGLPERQI
ncbi:MAG: HD domain-containing phosphohydrolase [Elusimicrobiota bacterium]